MAPGSSLTSSPVTPDSTAQPMSTSPTAIARLARARERSILRRPRRTSGGESTDVIMLDHHAGNLLRRAGVQTSPTITDP